MLHTIFTLNPDVIVGAVLAAGSAAVLIAAPVREYLRYERHVSRTVARRAAR